MHIERHKLRELQYLQEDIAEYFTDENLVSGETYWTCVEAVAIAKLAELRGDIIYTEDWLDSYLCYNEIKMTFQFQKSRKKNSGQKLV